MPPITPRLAADAMRALEARHGHRAPAPGDPDFEEWLWLREIAQWADQRLHEAYRHEEERG